MFGVDTLKGAFMTGEAAVEVGMEAVDGSFSK